jgi:hypothetical protein
MYSRRVYEDQTSAADHFQLDTASQTESVLKLRFILKCLLLTTHLTLHFRQIALKLDLELVLDLCESFELQ